MENDLKKLKSVIHSFSLGNQNNLYPKLDKITFPTLYISGEKDRKYTDIGKSLKKKSHGKGYKNFSR